jgi:hypothetical protein
MTTLIIIAAALFLYFLYEMFTWNRDMNRVFKDSFNLKDDER